MTDERTSKGRFVVFIGPDGVGKTTLADQLITRSGPPTLYIHFRPAFWTRPPTKPPKQGSAPVKRKQPGNVIFGWIRLTQSVWAFWLGYFRWIKPVVARQGLVVGDRWGYGYVGQPAALGFAGPSFLARFAARILPRPDLLIRLRGEPSLVAQRKKDLTTAEIALEDAAWDTLPLPFLELDAGLELATLVEMIMDRLSEKTSPETHAG